MTTPDLHRFLAAENLRDLGLLVGHVDSLSARLACNVHGAGGWEGVARSEADRLAAELRRLADRIERGFVPPLPADTE